MRKKIKMVLGFLGIILYIYILILAVWVLALVIRVLSIMSDVSPSAWIALAGFFLAVAHLARIIRRHGIILASIEAIVFLLILKDVSSRYGLDSSYIDEALKYLAEVPRLIVEQVVPWFEESVRGIDFSQLFPRN